MNTLKKEDKNKFFIDDFKDTSKKLEQTDKKVQFFVQIYSSILTVIFTGLIIGFCGVFNKNNTFLNF